MSLNNKSEPDGADSSATKLNYTDIMPEASFKMEDKTMGSDNGVTEDQNISELNTRSETHKFGLLQESSPKLWQEYDVVIVHGIRPTQWTDDVWHPGGEAKSSASWISDSLGLSSGRISHFHYPIDDASPSVLYVDGNEREAQNLLDGLVRMRLDFQEYSQTRGYIDVKLDLRPIIFVAHDIGGLIVKKALTLSTRNPAKYGDIPYCTNTLIFLGCLHRGTRSTIEDSIARLLLLPGGSPQVHLLDSIKALTRTVQQVNREFLDTKMLIRASVYNVFNGGILTQNDIAIQRGKVRVPMPFDSHNCYLDALFEFVHETGISHINLVTGDKSASDDSSKYVQALRGKLGSRPSRIKINPQITQYHKIFLSLAPPIVPPNPDDFKWQLDDLADWVIGSDQYKSWNNQPAMGVLHIKDSLNMRLISEKLYTRFLDEHISRNICFFAFRKNDDRFNTAGAMLASLICQLVSRCQTFGGAGEAITMLVAQRSWCERDLIQLFESLFDDIFIPFTVFMIACLDECNETCRQFLRLLKEIDTTSEKKFRFIFTTTNGMNESLEDVASTWFTIDIQDFVKEEKRGRSSTTESIYGVELKRLAQNKPTYRFFLNNIKEILTNCGDNHQLGHLMVDWLANYGPSGSQSEIRKALGLLSSASPQAAIEAILISFGNREKRARDILSWIRYTFESPTMRELATAMKLEDGISDEGLDDIDVDEIRGEIMQFGLVFSFSEYEVDLSHAMYPHEEAKPEEQAAAHAWIASLCLRYLSFPSVREQAKNMCKRYASATPISRPRQDLISYAVKYWPKHYKCAGNGKPVTEAKAFFHDTESREVWAQARYVLSNPVTRLERHDLSPLPLIAMAGLDDLLTAQIEDEKGMANFSVDAGLALIEAASNGDAHMVRLLAEASNPNKETLAEALVMAATVGDEGVLNFLIKETARFDSFDWPSILFPRVAWLGLACTAQLLLEASAKIPPSGGSFQKSTLHIAAETRNSGVMKVFLKETPNVDVKLVNYDATPLQYAAVRGDIDTIQMLINAGANVNASDDYDHTPVNLAIKHGKHLALEMLLKAGANIDNGTIESSYYKDVQRVYTAKPIVYAAILGRTKCVQLLLRHGADITATLNDKPALWHAASRGHLGVCQILRDAGVGPDQYPNGFKSVLEAALNSTADSRENLKLVELLISNYTGADNNSEMSHRQGNTLATAARLGSLKLVKHLLEQGVMPDSCEDGTPSPLYLASFHGHADIVDLLIQRGSLAVNRTAEKNWTPLHAAYDNPHIVKILLSNGADVDAVSESGTVVHLATKHRKTEVLSLILQHRPRPKLETLTDYEAHQDVTALCIACIIGHADIIRLLIQNGANINHKTRDGAFPLMLSIESATEDNISAIHTLLEFRPDLTQVDDNGNTGLHLIKESTPLAVIRDLYTAGFNAGVVNHRGDSVLSLAVSKNREAAKFLISKSFDINTNIPNIGTVLDILATKGDWELFEAAIDAGADIRPARSSGFGHTLLCSALTGSWDDNRERILRCLLVGGISPNEKCEDSGCSYAILKSATLGPGAIRLLLEYNANIEAQDAMGRRSMHIAAFKDISSVEALLENGAKLQPRTVTLMTPLHFAAASTQPLSSFLAIWDESIDARDISTGDIKTESQRINDEEKTIEEGSDVLQARLSIDDRDIDGWTPLMWAAKGTFYDTNAIRELCQRGADLWTRGKVLDAQKGDMMWSPLKVSRYYGAREYVYNALTPPEKIRILPNGGEERWNDEDHRTREAVYQSPIACSYCLMLLSGIKYKCKICDFYLCYKCFRQSSILHPEHTFEPEGVEFIAEEEESENEASKAPTEIEEDDAGLSPEALDDDLDDEHDEEDSDDSIPVYYDSDDDSS